MTSTSPRSRSEGNGALHSARPDDKPDLEGNVDSDDYDTELPDSAEQPLHPEEPAKNGKHVVYEGSDVDGKEEEGGDDTPKAPDGGYGWLVVLGCFLSHVITGGFERSDGVFFLQFLSRYGMSAQLTAWPGALVSTIRLFLGPVSSALGNRFSIRSTTMVGGILIAIGFILTSQSPNFYFLFFSHVFVHGIGRGLAYAPGLIIVGMYFDKRRGLAAGLGSAGVGVGTFLVVPMAQFVFDTYGFSGAFLVLAGFSFNMLLVAMLYRPLSMHLRFTRVRNAQKMRRIDTQEGVVLSEAADVWDDQSVRSWRSQSVSSAQRYEPPAPEKKAAVVVNNSVQKNSLPANRKEKGFFKSALDIIFPIEYKNKSNQTKKKLFNFQLLKNVPFLLYCLSIWLFTLAFKAAFTFLPALVKSRDISESKAALVLSIAGIVDTLGRIAAGLLLDREFIRPFRTILYNSFQFVVAAIAFIMPMMQDFWGFVAIACLYACFTGAYVSQKSVIVVDILGIEHMASSFGILICFQGLGTMMGPPLSGALKDHFGSYDEAFYLGGGCMILASLLMVASNVALSMQRRRKSRETKAAGSSAA
ncbi:monocarboxylate transporter 12 [Aplysia californica]|uniref:Monocarboxylate transporter 12 n=1 Tax=Aplysia californica TaxID=6500 RepID=A0ABM0K9Q7_APLCA|nr:monocarboxylate transporter 12 [Aplysia californica]